MILWREQVKVHVEADADPPAYRSAVVYVTLGEPLEGVEILLRLREGVAVTGCWPRWPDRMGEREALWLATLYPRRFEGGIVYSFGVRLDLQGAPPEVLGNLRWGLRGRAIVLEAVREPRVRALVGPLRPGFKVLSSLGRLEVVGEPLARYIAIEGRSVALELEAPGQSVVSGYLEFEPEDGEMPFEVEVLGLTNPVFERTMIVRLRDLHLD
ncbi:MAG: hypothetical protein QW448_04845 [Thermofilaceae archaeon]